MSDIGPRNIVAQLYGLFADLADGQEVHPTDVPFLDGAQIVTFTDEGTLGGSQQILIHTPEGPSFHITINLHR